MKLGKVFSRVLTQMLGLVWALSAASALAWSDKPVKVLIPAPPGGSIDVVARMLIEQLAENGITAIVDYKPGAGGAIAVKTLLAAPVDGTTIMMTSSNVLTEIPHVMKTGFDPLKDVRPVASVARGGLILVTNPSLPVQDVKEFVSYAKANVGKLSFASYSTGTASHYAGMILNQKAGLDLQHVPFQGSPPALVQLIGGQVTVMFDGLATALPQVKAGKLKALGIASATRSSHFPNVPTLAEQGFPDINYTGWLGVVVAATMPTELSEKIHASIMKALSSSKLVDKLNSTGFEASPAMSSATLANSVKADHERNAVTVRNFDIRLQ